MCNQPGRVTSGLPVASSVLWQSRYLTISFSQYLGALAAHSRGEVSADSLSPKSACQDRHQPLSALCPHRAPFPQHESREYRQRRTLLRLGFGRKAGNMAPSRPASSLRISLALCSLLEGGIEHEIVVSRPATPLATDGLGRTMRPMVRPGQRLHFHGVGEGERGVAVLQQGGPGPQVLLDDAAKRSQPASSYIWPTPPPASKVVSHLTAGRSRARYPCFTTSVFKRLKLL